MKRSSKRFFAAVLAAVTLITASASISASAAETETGAPVAVNEAVEEVAAPADDAQEAVAAVEETGEVAASVEKSDAVSEPEQQEDAPVIGRVTGLGKNTVNVNNINLVWNKVNGATGYIIYRCSADYDRGYFNPVAKVKTNSHNDTGLVQGCPYYYKVAAYVEKDGKTYEGEPTLYRTATQPANVSGLGRVKTSSTNTISWNRNYKATGYKIFRACAATKNQYVFLKTIESGATTSFQDTNISKGNVYYYKVVAFRVLYNVNWYHSGGSTVCCMGGLSVDDYIYNSQLYKVTLTWSRNPYATRYDVYYSEKKDAVRYTPAGSTTGTSLTTNTRFPNGKLLYFRVYPIYKKNGITITGTATTKAITVSNKVYGVATPNTYVEVCISQQRMWFFKNGKLIVDTPVVTGTKYVNDTPKGYFSMYQRATDTVLTGPGYASPVDYWMAFCGGCGIHDASWRSSFGGSIYTYNGSHGCVNTPYNAVRTIYNNTTYGTPVIVY